MLIYEKYVLRQQIKSKIKLIYSALVYVRTLIVKNKSMTDVHIVYNYIYSYLRKNIDN